MSVDLSDFRAHVRADEYETDSALDIYLTAATDYASRYTCVNLSSKNVVTYFSSFQDRNVLIAPVNDKVEIKYLDKDGTQQVLPQSEYHCATNSMTPYFVSATGSWPATLNHPEAVSAHYSSGYTRETLPSDLRAAILLIAAHLYENREDASDVRMHKIPMGAHNLLRPHRQQHIT